MVLLAPVLLSFLMTTVRSRPWAVLTRMLETNFCKRIRSRSGKPRLGENAEGSFFLKNSMKRLMSWPGLYITPVAMSMFKYILFSEGRMDWKYPLHSSKPPPIGFFPSEVKKERVLNGYFWLGSIRITTFKALEVQVNERNIYSNRHRTHHDGGKYWIVLRLLSLNKTMQYPKGGVRLPITGQDEGIVLGIDFCNLCHLHFVYLGRTTPRSGRRALTRERYIKLDE